MKIIKFLSNKIVLIILFLLIGLDLLRIDIKSTIFFIKINGFNPIQLVNELIHIFVLLIFTIVFLFSKSTSWILLNIYILGFIVVQLISLLYSDTISNEQIIKAGLYSFSFIILNLGITTKEINLKIWMRILAYLIGSVLGVLLNIWIW